MPTMTGQRSLILPRFGTPRDERRETLGGQVALVADRLGMPLYPWQRHVIDVALELDDDGRFVYKEIDLTVPRQSGKTTLQLAKMVWRATIAQRSLGRQTITYTAQTRNAARRKLERDFAEALRMSPGSSFREVRNPRDRPSRATEWKLSLNNGSEHILFGRGNYLNIDAPTKRAGHGDTLDDGTIDEAFAHQTDDVEQAMEPAMQTRRNSQLWVLSTAGDENSLYLWRKVVAGRRACETGDHGRVAYFEWSLPDDAPFDDEDLWASFHPNIDHPEVLASMRAALSKALRNPDDPDAGLNAFRRGFCNQWPKVPRLPSDRVNLPIPVEAWDACLDQVSSPSDPVVFAVDSAPDRSWSTIVVAARRPDGLVHVEIVDSRAGVSWIGPAMTSLVSAWSPVAVVVESRSPAMSELAQLEASGASVVKVPVAQYAAFCGGFKDRVAERTVRHRGEMGFRLALDGLRSRKVGESLFSWSRADATADITPIVAATLAVAHLPVSGPSPFFAY